MGSGNRPMPEFRREAVRLALTSGRTRREIAEDLGIGKPDPAPFLEALKRGESEASAAVHIGDHPGDDIAGAQRAGLRAVWFNPQGKAIGHIALPERCANLCFGGEKGNRLFMASSHGIYSLFVNARGATFIN